jgi:putative ABC transport system substrate-binding protein
MDRRIFVARSSLGALALPRVAVSQPAAKVARVGYLESGAAAGTPFLAAFREGLRGLGWVEGQNLTLEVRSADGEYGRLRELACELARLDPDVIFASSTSAALAAKGATSKIPIVIGRVADPVASGLVASLARPGGNITGWTHQGLEMRVKYLDLIKEAIPSASRVGVLWNPGNPVHAPSLKHIESAARSLKLTLHPVGVSQPGEIAKAFAALGAADVHALVVFQDGMFLSHGLKVVQLAAQNRLPTIYGASELVRDGGLMGYGVNLRDMYRHGATFVDRILKGAKPSSLPVEQPTRFELLINLKAAKALGLALPQPLLLRADEVIE